MVTLRSLLGLSEPAQTHGTLDLSGDSPELRKLLAGVLTIGTNGLSVPDEANAFGIPAFSRGVELIAGTIAGLPLKTYQEAGATRRGVASAFDDPAGALGMVPFSWVETVIMHLVAYREAFLQHVTNDGGAVIGYWPIIPDAVQKVSRAASGHKRFDVHYADGDTKTFGTPADPTSAGIITHILGPSISALRGTPLWETHRALFQIAIAAEQATARTFTGALIRGLVTTAADEDVDEAEALVLQEKLNAKIAGVEHAGEMAFVNRHLDFKAWQSTNADAQFNESRAFQIEEFARLLGMPPHLLAQTEKATSWGTGISEQNLGLSRYTLMGYTSRVESALKPLLPDGEFLEFDYKGLLQGAPAEEIKLLIEQVDAGILTKDEARAILNLAPLPSGAGALATIAGQSSNGKNRETANV